MQLTLFPDENEKPKLSLTEFPGFMEKGDVELLCKSSDGKEIFDSEHFFLNRENKRVNEAFTDSALLESHFEERFSFSFKR